MGRPPHPDILTPREWQVLELLRAGMTNQEIAARLGISADGAKYHVSEIISKLGVSGRREAARWRAPEPAARRFGMAALFGGLGPKATATAAGRVALGAATVAVAAGLGVLAWGLLSVDKGPVDLNLRSGVYVVDQGGTRLSRIAAAPYVCETQCGEEYALLSWSPDGRELLINDSFAGADSLRIATVDGGSLRDLGVRAWSAVWLQDAEVVAHAQLDASATNPREALVSIDPASAAWREIGPARSGLGLPVVSPDGARLLVVDREPQFRLLLVDRRTGEERELARLDPLFLRWAPDSGMLAFNVVNNTSGSSSPLDLLVLQTDGTEVRRVQAGRAPVWSPDGSHLATIDSRYPDGREQTWIMLVEASGTAPPRALTRGSHPSFSPDGHSLAFLRDGEVWRIDIDGKNERKIVASALPMVMEVQWSPDASNIALIAVPGGGELYEIAVDGKGERYIGPGSGAQWSPDGKRIAFYFRSGIYVMTMSHRRINQAGETYYRDTIGPCTSGRRFDWSLDGEMLAYWADDPGGPGVYVWDGKVSRRIARGSGPDWRPSRIVGFTATNQLTCSVRLVDADGSNETLWRDKTRDIDWSPDGRYALYTDAPNPGPLLADTIISTADGRTELRRLAPGTRFAWSPDSSRFAYVRRPESGPPAEPGLSPPVAPTVAPPDVAWTLIVGSPDRAADVEVVAGIGLEFAWSPDGKQIAYAIRHDYQSRLEIYIVSLDDPSNRRYLTTGSAPAWSPDGKTIIVRR